MAANKTTVRAMNTALNYLDPKSPAFGGSNEVRAALLDPNLRVYLQSWVFPMLVRVRDGFTKREARDLQGDPITRRWVKT